MNFAQSLMEALQSRSGTPCLELSDAADWSCADLARTSGAWAGRLAARGVVAGDRVVVQVEKSPEAVALYLGVLRLGAVFVPLNTAYTDAEVEQFLRDAEPVCLLCAPARSEGLQPIASAVGCELLVLDDRSWSMPVPELLDALGVAGVTVPGIAERSGDDLAAIVYTSGTTGRSKGAMLSHDNLRSNAETLVALWGFTERDVLVHALPIFHVHGLFVALHTALLAGSKVRFLPAFDVERVHEALRGATALMGVPTFYTRLLDLDGFGRDSCATMRLFVSGSAPLLAQTHDAFAERTGHRVLERYGMSETGMITSNPLDGERVAGTVGFALPGVAVRVADRDSGEILPAGDVGTVEVTGPNVFSGYWRLPEKTAEEHRPDGWFITGDLGFLDEGGRLTLVGRGKDLIISGGYNIYPKEIEQVLDGVVGVLESAAIGVPHADLGEGTVAVLVADPSATVDRGGIEATIRVALEERLARFKHPRRFAWVDDLPRNAMGKVQKNMLRDRFQDAYGE